MKLATIRRSGHTTAVRLDGDALVDLGQPDVGAVLAQPGWAAAAQAADGPRYAVADADFAPLVPQPSKVVCVGLNYRNHIQEMGRDLPEYPTLFAKFGDCLIGAHDDIVRPPETEKFDWEVELAVVIGAPVRRATAAQAEAAIAGFTVLNDITCRDWQFRTREWLQGKAWDATTPVGPYLVTPDELPGGVRPALDDSLRWVAQGTALSASQIAGLSPEQYAEASALPGWTRAHLVAHLAANADALRNLVRWAATGIETPMYASSDQRAQDIEDGSRRPPAELQDWFGTAAARLERDMAALSEEQWAAPVVTAQGRTVPAAQIGWLRAREVLVHAVDLATGLRFADLPDDFLLALQDDIVTKRGVRPDVSGSLPDVTAYLAGRPAEGVVGADGRPAPALGPWL